MKKLSLLLIIFSIVYYFEARNSKELVKANRLKTKYEKSKKFNGTT